MPDEPQGTAGAENASLLRLASLDKTGGTLARLGNPIGRRRAWQPGRAADRALLNRVRSLFSEEEQRNTILFQPDRGLLFFNLDAIPVPETAEALSHLVDRTGLDCRIFIDDNPAFLWQSMHFAFTDMDILVRQRRALAGRQHRAMADAISQEYEKIRSRHLVEQHLLPHVLIVSFAWSSSGSGSAVTFSAPDERIKRTPSDRRKLPPRLRLPAHDELPVTIYLADETIHEQVEAAVEALLGIADLRVNERDEAVIGSWFRRLWAGTKKFAQSPAGREAALTATHAADSRLILAQDAYVTATLLQNLGPVLVSLQPTKDAVLRIGALLIVKVEWVVQVYQLTASQQAILDHNPELATKPGEVIAALQLSTTAKAAVPAAGEVGAALPRSDAV